MDAGCLPQQVAGETENITKPPKFRVVHDDPVSVALSYAKSGIRVPFICAAHRCAQLTRRISVTEAIFGIHHTLTRTRPGTDGPRLYPIPAAGGIFSDRVVVYLGTRDKYEYLDPILDVPVVLVSPVRQPKLIGNGSSYPHGPNELIMREKICEALRICLHNNYDRVVIGDFGLGETYHNPPQAVAEIWRDLLLFHPDLCGQFESVDFAFVDQMQSHHTGYPGRDLGCETENS
ncbi:hypothetical protein E4U56_007484 [Claviceps arundinis]|uniref:Microbial-type PARG catalytic domain-containing protein n=1 Tax=Claviceps arundinis TaxID=1623583 RepID=A0A9P7MUX5_9HYPO|nr:hypothetical protein E4U56_007484 [Claviceps arundinis]